MNRSSPGRRSLEPTRESRRQEVLGGRYVWLCVIEEAKRAPTPIAPDQLDDRGWSDAPRSLQRMGSHANAHSLRLLEKAAEIELITRRSYGAPLP